MALRTTTKTGAQNYQFVGCAFGVRIELQLMLHLDLYSLR